MRLLMFYIGIVSISSLTAQKLTYPDEVLSKLNQMSLDIVMPTESDYRDVFVIKNSVVRYDFAIKSRQEKLEIRYIFRPLDTNDPLISLPDIHFIKMLTHLATNREEALPMVIHEVAPSDLKNAFQADWGRFAFFQPKGEFAAWQHAKLLSLYRAEKGMVYVLFLFNKASANLDRRFHAVQFSDAL